MDTSNTVAIVVPVYTDALSDNDIISLKRLNEVMSHHPVIFVKPESLSPLIFITLCPTALFENFPDYMFAGKKAYNNLMMSETFYGRFLGYKYILIYQTDCYIFRDELRLWCDKGFDYVGAPWIKRDVYNRPFIRTYMKISRYLTKLLNKPDRQELFNRVGNGGLSLRNVKRHYDFIKEYPLVVKRFTDAKQFHLFNEDVFWSIEVNKHLSNPFRYPDHITALSFSFDKHPDYCFKMAGNKLPFGCHSWSQKKMIGFWTKIILKDGQSR